MAQLLTNLIKVVRAKNRDKLKRKIKRIVERDRVLYNKVVRMN